jgi:ClpP class serine protease
MAREQRLKIIESIEKERGSRVITYVTSTRKNLEVPMAMDAVRRIYDHLETGSANGKVDLFLHSNGGEGTVPWRLVTLIRERAERFAVLVPFRAFSAATLTVLGADEVVMHPMGMLGPTDPTVANAFNPPDPTNPMKRLGISVEDVTAYIALIKEDAGIQHEDELVKAFNRLAKQVHPLALGNVKRSLSQSRMMAEKLLSLHMDPKKKLTRSTK